jgi:FMN-binding domain
MRAGAPTLVTILFASAFEAPAFATVYLTQADALKLAFPAGSTVERTSAFLTETQLATARSRAGAGIEIASAIVTHYVGKDAHGRSLGTAYFDTHRVRTLDETIMVVVGPAGRVTRVEILSFAEPPDYLPKKNWLEQFAGRALDPELSVRRGIHVITGATLSSHAATDAVRRVLALDEILK